MFDLSEEDEVTLPYYNKSRSLSRGKRRFSFKNIQEAHAAKV